MTTENSTNLNHNDRTFLFGYGSLIQTESRVRTCPGAAIAFPAILMNYRRLWNARPYDHETSPTYLGLLPNNGFQTNGVIFEVTSDDLSRLDKRELKYQRITLSPNSIHFHLESGKSLLNDKDRVFTYLFLSDDTPTQDHPVLGMSLRLLKLRTEG